MDRLVPCVFAFLSVTLWALAPATGQTPIDTAWEQLPQYAYGQDLGPLLAIERAVIEAMGSPAVRAGDGPPSGRVAPAASDHSGRQQFICLQLRQIGTPAEIPILTPLLLAPETFRNGPLRNRDNSWARVDRRVAIRARYVAGRIVGRSDQCTGCTTRRWLCREVDGTGRGAGRVGATGGPPRLGAHRRPLRRRVLARPGRQTARTAADGTGWAVCCRSQRS